MMPPMCLYTGICENLSFQDCKRQDVDCHVANDEIYKCGVELATGELMKYDAKSATARRSFARFRLASCSR